MRRAYAQGLLVLSFGAVCHVGQIVLLRELLMVFHGNELSLGVVFAAWMMWVGIGSRAGARIAERGSRPAAGHLAATASLVLLPATVLFIRVLRSFFAVDPGAYLSLIDLVVASVFVTAPVGLLLGAQFVMLSRMWRVRDRSEDTGGADKTYIFEALGNAAGGALFSLLLVRVLNQLEIIVGVVLLLIFATLMATRGASGRSRVALWGALAVALAVFPLLGRVDSWAYRMQWRFFSPEHELLSVYQSRYGAVSIARREDQHSFFQSGNLLFSASGAPGQSPPDDGRVSDDPVSSDDPVLSGPSFEEHESIVSAHFAMSQHPDPRRVLLIGGGLGGSLREILRHPVERVDYVELDPVVTDTARRYLHPDTAGALDRDEVRLVHGDGRQFLRGRPGPYDVIIIDVPDPATAALNRYYTEEFFHQAAARLEPGGVIALGADSTPGLRSSPVANRNATIYHTLSRVFSNVIAVGDRHLRFFASNSEDAITGDPAVLRGRFEERDVEAPGFSAGQFAILLEQGPLLRVNEILMRHGRSADAHLAVPERGALVPSSLAELRRAAGELPAVNERFFVNSDFRPIGYLHTLEFWNQLTRSDHSGVFRPLLHVRPWWIAPPSAIAVAIAAALRLRSRHRGSKAGRADPAHRFAVLFAVFTTGLSTIALQIALLFTFQSVYGFVYEMIGLITAGFMTGLALGAAFSHRFVRDKGDARVLQLVQVVIALFAAVIAVVLPAAAGVESVVLLFTLFFAITVFAGVLNGVDFPLAAACCMAAHRQAERATGAVYGTELFGSCVGAVVAGVVVAPVLGIVACCVLAAIGNATAFVVLLISGRSYGRA